MEAGLGLGNLVGGFVIGLLGPRLAKGRLVILGYAAYGACIVALGLTGNVAAALGLAVGIGVANMVFVIPSQTLFQQRTPGDMIGRVVGIRFSLVFASLSIAMAASGFLVNAFGVATVLIAFGTSTAIAGLAGLLVPALRDA
jgi:MFS family permease